MDNSINSSDKISSAPPPPSSGKGQGVRKKTKAAAAAKTTTEGDSYVRSDQPGGENYIQSTAEERPEEKEIQNGFITAGDIYSFVEAYNRLPDALGDDFSAVRAEVYKPVKLNGQGRQISLYEIGVAHSPNSRREGALSVDDGVLTAALKNRSADVHALFLQEDGGLLERLRLIVKKQNSFTRFCESLIRSNN